MGSEVTVDRLEAWPTAALRPPAHRTEYFASKTDVGPPMANV